MKHFIGCDVHKRYSVFVTMHESGQASRAVRVEHGNVELERYLSSLPDGSPVAVETTGHWYWILDAMEKAGLEPHLAHALAAKRMMVSPNKTDKLDAKGLATLLRNGTLGTRWITARLAQVDACSEQERRPRNVGRTALRPCPSIRESPPNRNWICWRLWKPA